MVDDDDMDEDNENCVVLTAICVCLSARLLSHTIDTTTTHIRTNTQ